MSVYHYITITKEQQQHFNDRNKGSKQAEIGYGPKWKLWDFS